MRREARLTVLILVVLAVIGTGLRLAPLSHANLSFAYHPDDSFEYMQLAQGIRHGCGFARFIGGSCQSPEILRTPVYPLFLAAVGDNVRWALAVQALLGGLVCLLVGMCLARYWNRNAAVVAELFIAFDLPSIVMSNAVMSEAIFQILALLAILLPLLTLRHPRYALVMAVLAGILGSAAILSRPIGIILPILLPIPFLAVSSLELRQRLRAGALALAIPLLAISGWSARNYLVARYPGLSTVGAINMYYYRAADIVARLNGVALAATRPAFGARLGVPYERIYEARVQSPELVQQMNQLAFGILEAHPFEATLMTLQGTAYLALSPIRTQLAAVMGTAGGSQGDGLNAGALSLSRIRNTLRTMLQSPLLSGLVACEALLTILLWIGIARAAILSLRKRNEYLIWVAYLIVTGAGLLVLAAGGEADVRFRAPVIPLLAVVAALGYFPSQWIPIISGGSHFSNQ